MRDPEEPDPASCPALSLSSAATGNRFAERADSGRKLEAGTAWNGQETGTPGILNLRLALPKQMSLTMLPASS